MRPYSSVINTLAKYYADQPFREHKNDECRFFFENPNFSYGEAIVYYGMLRHLHPRRVIEVGSGYSTALLLDTLEHQRRSYRLHVHRAFSGAAAISRQARRQGTVAYRRC